MYSKLLILLFAICLVFSACDPKKSEPTETSSFGLIQDQILTPTCATSGCHASDKEEIFAQHKLVLAKGLAYKYLINTESKNSGAKADGLLRVKPFSSDKSLLYHKLLYDNSHHGGKSYGSVMPLGKDLLSVGQIEFIRRWIEAGAPETGNVADEKLLEDKTPSVANFTPLAAPAANAGYQMKLEQFDVPPNFERELFIRKPLNNSETVYINRVQIKMRPGSHHFILYDFRDKTKLPELNVFRDLRSVGGNGINLPTFLEMANHVFMFGGAESNSDYTFPDGIAVEVPKETTFDMNSHYFNKGTKPIPGEVYINLYTVPKAKVTKVVKILDLAITQELKLPANTKTILTKDFIFGADSKIVTLFSHTHKFGEKFEILIKGGPRNGEVVYTSENWEHPEKINYSPFISIKKGEGLTSRITYNNTSSKYVGFGFTSEDEMGIIFGYYYEE